MLPKDVPRHPQSLPKATQRPPKRYPKVTQEVPKLTPKDPRHPQKVPQDLPNGTQRSPKGFHNSPKRSHRPSTGIPKVRGDYLRWVPPLPFQRWHRRRREFTLRSDPDIWRHVKNYDSYTFWKDFGSPRHGLFDLFGVYCAFWPNNNFFWGNQAY